MALNKREKNLALVTGALVVLVVGYFLFSGLTGPLKTRRAERDNLREKVRTQHQQVKLMEKAVAKLADWRRRSLPSDPQIAKELYQNWLLELVEDVVGLQAAKVMAGEGRPLVGVYHRLPFTVSGRGNLGQLTELLYEFYSAGHLHLIRGMSIKPMRGSRDLELSITVEALSLTDADRQDELADVPSSRLAGAELAYYESIGNRNLFAPYEPPRLEPVIREEPQGPPPPQFDPSKYAFVTGIVEVGGRPRIFLKARTTGEMFSLEEGDQFELGPVRGTVLQINHRDAEIDINGQRRVVALGESLQPQHSWAASNSSAASNPGPPAGSDGPPESEKSSDDSGWLW